MSCIKKMFRGVTMLEMLLVLSVIAVLLILATRYYMSTSYSQKVSQLQAEINALRAAVENYKNIDPTFANAPAANIIHTLYTSGYLSKADLDSTTQTNAVTPWNQNITVAYASTSGQITITYPVAATGSSADNACHAVASAITANSSSSDVTANCTSGFSYSFLP